jgi:hypothetical protein
MKKEIENLNDQDKDLLDYKTDEFEDPTKGTRFESLLTQKFKKYYLKWLNSDPETYHLAQFSEDVEMSTFEAKEILIALEVQQCFTNEDCERSLYSSREE